MDEELDWLRLVGLPVDMQRWNIEDLGAYVKVMKAEIRRVENITMDKE